MRLLSLIAIIFVAFAQANHTVTTTVSTMDEPPAEDKIFKLILTGLVKAGDDPPAAACLAFFLKFHIQIKQNKSFINEHNVDQVVRAMKEENKHLSLLCTHGIMPLTIGLVISFILLIVCCCTCCCLASQACRRSNNGVISGSKKRKQGDKVEMYSPAPRKQITDV